MLLFTCHTTRRLLECLLMTHSEKSYMSILAYFVGITHYVATPLTHALELQTIEQNVDNGFPRLEQVIAIGLFVWSSFHQWKCHSILAKLKIDMNKPKNKTCERPYGIPRGDWFDTISCPHYFAEILIYLSLAIAMSNKSSWHILFWVASNLSISARRSHNWYLTTFKRKYPRRNILLPYIW